MRSAVLATSLRIIDRDSEFLQSPSNNPRNGSLYIMKEGSLLRLKSNMLFIYILFNLCSKRNIRNIIRNIMYAIHFSRISACTIVNEDDRNPRCFPGCSFSNEWQELPEGGFALNTQQMCYAYFAERSRNRFNEYMNCYTVFRVRYSGTKQ